MDNVAPTFESGGRDLHWKARAVMATKGNQTLWGAIFQAAVLGRVTDNPPRILSNAEISSEGWVIAGFQKRDETTAQAGFRALCHIDDLVKAFRLLADHLKLKDEERVELFASLRMWIEDDHRVTPAPLE